MCLKLSVLLLSLSISIALARKLQFTLKTDDNIRQLHSKSMVLAEGNRATSPMCFSTYNPQLDHVTAEYQVAYDGCLSTFETSSQQVENAFKKERISIEADASQSCSALDSCNSSPKAYDAFRCASIAAAEDAKIFYDISARATDSAENCREQYSYVFTQKDICLNNAERSFVEETTRVYGELNICLQNGIIVSNQPPSSWTTEFTYRTT